MAASISVASRGSIIFVVTACAQSSWCGLTIQDCHLSYPMSHLWAAKEVGKDREQKGGFFESVPCKPPSLTPQVGELSHMITLFSKGGWEIVFLLQVT